MLKNAGLIALLLLVSALYLVLELGLVDRQGVGSPAEEAAGRSRSSVVFDFSASPAPSASPPSSPPSPSQAEGPREEDSSLPASTGAPSPPCAAWGCTCQGLSDTHGVDHSRGFYADAPRLARHWWRRNRCKTSPSSTAKAAGGGAGNRSDADDDASRSRSGAGGTSGSLQSLPSRSRQPGAGGEAAAAAEEEGECGEWNCTCQGLSERFKSSHNARVFAFAPVHARVWWVKHRCHTNPKPDPYRPPHRNLTGPQLDNGTVCYFMPARARNERTDAIERSWGRGVPGRLFFVLSLEGNERNYVDFERGEIHVAHRNYTDPTGKLIRGYDPEFVGRYGKIAVKMAKFWEFLSASFDDLWASRCTWFVRTDDDTWLNTRLVEERLACLDPEWELSFGFTNRVWGIGIFTGYSRKWVRNFAYFIRVMRERAGAAWMHADVDDRRLGQVVNTFGLGTIELVAHNGSDYFTNIDGHTTDQHLVANQLRFAKTLDPEFVGCMTFFHTARPPVMATLTEKVDAHRNKHGGATCPDKWRTKGMHFALRLMIEHRCNFSMEWDTKPVMAQRVPK